MIKIELNGAINTRRRNLYSPGKAAMLATMLGAVSILMLSVAFHERQLASASINWPTTQGHITSSYNHYSRSSWCEGPEPNASYSFQVNGTEYKGNRIAFNPTWAQSHGDAEKLFPVGKEVMVRYSPDNPRHSCLEIGDTGFFGWLADMGYFILAVALALANYAWKKKSSSGN